MDGRPRLRVALLGELLVYRGDLPVHLAGARLRSLLVRLALAGGRAVEAAVLTDAVWPGEAPPGPAALQMLVSRLRRALGPDDVVVTRAADGYRLEVDAADVDVLHFERLVSSGRQRLSAGDPVAACALLTDALDLWGDRPGAEPAVLAAAAPSTAVRLTRVSVDAAVDLADAELALGRAGTAEARLTGLAREHEIDERVAALLMDALAAQGRQAEALAVFERVRETLADVLGADPGSALAERHLRLLRSPPQTAVPSPPSTLPEPLTSFVGRDDDLARITALLASGRLVTVLGPGGAGKTRLAVEAARRLPFRDGTWMIDLTLVTAPEKTAAAVLSGIGLRGGTMLDTRRPPQGDEADLLVDELSGRECLLLFDNCEHVVDAVARLITRLLTRCRGVRVLATSREPLAVDGEVLVPLGPLALPDHRDGPEQARLASSVRLFAERAAAVRPGFAVDESTVSDVVRIVRGLDGLPLALELAAARLRALSLEDVAGGLSDRFRLLAAGSRTPVLRHRTLHAVVTWSWDLLGEHERTVAERISVLPGGITTAAAAAVCADTGIPADEVPGLLAALVDRSLLHLAAGRYRMLETIREYGVGRLAEGGTLSTTRDLAAAHSIAVMAHHDARLRGPGQLSAVRDIDAEYPNALAALRHLCATHDAAGAIALSLSLTWFWQMSGRHSEGSDRLGEVLALPGAEPTPERDCLLAVDLINRADSLADITPGTAVTDGGDVVELAHRLLSHRKLPGQYAVFGPVLLFLHDQEAALDHFGRLAEGNDVWLAGLAHLFQAEIAENAGELERMRHHVDAALDRYRQAGDSWGRAAVLSMRARLLRYDDLDGALADLLEAEALAGGFGSLSLSDRLYRDLRWIDLHFRRGATGEAVALLDSARQRAARASSAEMLIVVNAREAELRVRLGDLAEGDELLVNAERLLHKDSTAHTRTLVCNARAAWCLAVGDVPRSAAPLAAAHEAALSTQELPVVALVLVTAAARAEALRQHHDAALLLGAASRLRGTHDRTDPQILDLTVRSKNVLGAEGFAAAYAAGWELDGEQASHVALFTPII
ncbi:BTAD domain-containing putative transcriptional regulator [Lentzea sp. CA-135723]|uniref:BTAD domain-containing putative transcriptional regulator n=1 Tax=Lentzea sp. CA-135723 TaxID=3239950 RepID=UPI003D8CE2C8